MNPEKMALQGNQNEFKLEPFTTVYSEDTSKWIAEDFPYLNNNNITYLDNAAAALYSKSQMDRVHGDLLNNIYCNPHTSGNFGKIRDVNESVREMRHRILRYFNANDQNYKVIFTSGATAACKLLAEVFPWSLDSSTFVYLDECHTSVVGMRELATASQVVKESDINLEMLCDTKTNLNLFAFPAMSNFCGKKYPYKQWIDMCNSSASDGSKWYTLLDAASYVATNQLDLQYTQPDFVSISFYKIFGYPTGLGALLVKCSVLDILTKKYFGGGTVDMNLVRRKVHAPKSSSPEGSFK